MDKSSRLCVYVSWRYCLVAALIAVGGKQAQAQPQTAPDPTVVCAPDRRQLASKNEQLAACSNQRQSLSRQMEECSSNTQDVQQKLSTTAAELEAVKDQREALCTASGALAVGILDGRTSLPSIGLCTSPTVIGNLENLVKSWRQTQTSLIQLVAWSAGETDAEPANPGSSTTGPAAVVRRLVGAGKAEVPLPLRRLLVEAVRLVAPQFLRQLRASGAADGWFFSSAELDPGFLSEADAVLGSRGAGLGPRQASALRFVQTFQEVAGCNQKPAPRECGRARRLQEFLESSAPLIVRQRVQEIWVHPCGEVQSKTVLAWLRELPSTQGPVSQAAAAQASAAQSNWEDILQSAYDKIVSCYLSDESPDQPRFSQWLVERLPQARELTSRSLRDIDQLRGRFSPSSLQSTCLDAVHALRNLQTPHACALPAGLSSTLRSWFQSATTAEAGVEGALTQACATFVRGLWMGEQPRVLESYPGPPAAASLVKVARDDSFKPTRALRVLCDSRVGSPQDFPATLREVGEVASAAGENISASPWRLDGSGSAPQETEKYEQTASPVAWISSRTRGEDPCLTLALPTATCRACQGSASLTRYDCFLLSALKSRWSTFRSVAAGLAVVLASLAFMLLWGIKMARALRSFGPWRRELKGHLVSMGLPSLRDPGRVLFPSRMSSISFTLPQEAVWERWGRRAVITRAEAGTVVTAKDVTRAALAARGQGAELALLCHKEGASPDLGAVRAILDWAARGPHKSMQVLPLSIERLRWIRTAEDLLDLIEQTSLRGNPFELRGRLVSSSQFFNRERLVSGLISACQAGHWTIITGLRRFGKSSLALEVARRLQGAYAYVDLAGFHHEVSSSENSAGVADSILRYVCEQLHASALKIYPNVSLNAVPTEGTSLDASAFGAWMRALVAACRKANGDRPATLLVILDELEQAIGVGPQRISRAVDVMSIVVGRLRTVLNETSMAQGGDRIGVLFCSALHPLLWAPLTTLSQQSLLGEFSSVFVPRLPDEAARSMMRGLGARQGIRFAEAALEMIVREAQGIPILVRRIGSAVLELYDPERARQGGLGAVEIGVGGATAAVAREEEDGAPLRVWVESEIGDPHNPAGVLLRALAVAGRMSVVELRRLAATVTKEQFVASGIAALLSEEEVARRSDEAAGYIVRMLGEIGILEPEGGQLQPEGYVFPESIVRRILATPRRDSLMGF